MLVHLGLRAQFVFQSGRKQIHLWVFSDLYNLFEDLGRQGPLPVYIGSDFSLSAIILSEPWMCCAPSDICCFDTRLVVTTSVYIVPPSGCLFVDVCYCCGVIRSYQHLSMMELTCLRAKIIAFSFRRLM